MPTNKTRISVPVSDEDMTRLSELATNEGRSVANYTGRLIERALGEMKLAETQAPYQSKPPAAVKPPPGAALNAGELLGHQATAKKGTGRK